MFSFEKYLKVNFCYLFFLRKSKQKTAAKITKATKSGWFFWMGKNQKRTKQIDFYVLNLAHFCSKK